MPCMAVPMRAEFMNVNMASSPLFGSAIIWPTASSKFNTAVAEARIPILCSIEPQVTGLRSPSEPSGLTRYLGTMNSDMPRVPAGARGISLFIVPKYLVKPDGSLGERNPVTCGSIEHKMGIRASATAVLNFDEAVGHMIAEPNKGLEAMFTFMNSARIGTAIQGIAHAEASFQGALPYARERRSMRALSGKKDPDYAADALIWHPDVRRMLLTQKAIAEGGRAMIYSAAQLADKLFNAVAEGNQARREEFDD